MSPWQGLILLLLAVLFSIAGWGIGKDKGHPALGWVLGFVMGLLGVIIIACVPRTEAAKAITAQRQYQFQAEAARRAGYPYLQPPAPPGHWEHAPAEQQTWPQQ
jgi:hypothetical protein